MIKNYFKLVRLEEWAPTFFILFVGYMLAGNVSLSHANAIFIALVSFLSIGAFGFIVNDYFDREYDKKKKDNRNPISANIIDSKKAVILALFLASFGLLVSYTMLPRVFPLFLASVALLVVYSVPPFRFKEKFAFDILVNAFDMPVLFMIGYTLFGEISTSIYLLSLEILLLSLTSGVLQEIRDHDADRKSGFSTTVVRLGIKKSIILLRLILVIFTVLFSLTVYKYFPLYFMLLLVPPVPVIKFIFLENVKKEISSRKLTSIFHKCYLVLIFVFVAIFLISAL